ncbi:MAG: biotin/lipoyl-binding protein, partial [Deltaproteobacteria bacterium]
MSDNLAEGQTSMNWKTFVPKNLKKSISILAVVLIAAGGWYWYSSAAQKQEQGTVQPIAVARANIEEVVTSQGKLEAKQYVDVGTQVSGQLKAIHVDIGDTVTKGQLLAEI